MATQSRLPAFLLTRPKAQSDRFAADLRQRFGPDIAVCISPLLTPKMLEPALPTTPIAALIFTSETGVAAYAAHRTRPAGLPQTAFCVGNRTAQAAKSARLEPISANGDASTLIALIQRHAPNAPLLHICGTHTRGEVAQTLSAAGLPTTACTLYEQAEQPLSAQAIALLQGESPLLVPLFSPRSAALFCTQAVAAHYSAPLTCVALSPAVGDALSGLHLAKLCYADRPTADALLQAIADSLPQLR
jgi:uroporphyrinogen-III synthase